MASDFAARAAAAVSAELLSPIGQDHDLLTALYTALYDSPALIMIVGPSQRQSAEAFRALMTLYGKLDEVPTLRQESVLRAELRHLRRQLMHQLRPFLLNQLSHIVGDF